MDLRIDFCLKASDVVTDLAGGSHGEGDRGVLLRDCLVENYERLHRRLLCYLGCPDLASDCLHDTWLRLGETVLCEAVRNPEAYVYRVACNIAIDRLRSSRSLRYTDDADIEPEHFADPFPGPDAIAVARSDMAALERAMLRLPRRHQAVLVALRVDGLSRHEVATRHGLSLRHVDTVLRQALDYCAEQTGRPASAGIRAPRRALRLQAAVDPACKIHLESMSHRRSSPVGLNAYFAGTGQLKSPSWHSR